MNDNTKDHVCVCCICSQQASQQETMASQAHATQPGIYAAQPIQAVNLYAARDRFCNIEHRLSKLEALVRRLINGVDNVFHREVSK